MKESSHKDLRAAKRVASAIRSADEAEALFLPEQLHSDKEQCIAKDMQEIWHDLAVIESQYSYKTLLSRPYKGLWSRLIENCRNLATSFKPSYAYVTAGFFTLGLGLFVLMASHTEQALDVPAMHYATKVGEVKRISLADGSSIDLSGKTKITVSFDAQTRRVEILNGEVFFQVAKDSQRDFSVFVANKVVRVVGTQFNVKKNTHEVTVSVSEGIVQVGDADKNQAMQNMQKLSAGQQVSALFKQSFGKVQAYDINLIAAWKTGHLHYNNERLDIIVEDLNRYYAPGVSLAAGAAGDIRISTALQIQQIPAVMASLQQLFPVSTVKNKAGHIVVSTE